MNWVAFMWQLIDNYLIFAVKFITCPKYMGLGLFTYDVPQGSRDGGGWWSEVVWVQS